jgi:hypothetical protein
VDRRGFGSYKFLAAPIPAVRFFYLKINRFIPDKIYTNNPSHTLAYSSTMNGVKPEIKLQKGSLNSGGISSLNAQKSPALALSSKDIKKDNDVLFSTPKKYVKVMDENSEIKIPGQASPSNKSNIDPSEISFGESPIENTEKKSTATRASKTSNVGDSTSKKSRHGHTSRTSIRRKKTPVKGLSKSVVDCSMDIISNIILKKLADAFKLLSNSAAGPTQLQIKKSPINILKSIGNTSKKIQNSTIGVPGNSPKIPAGLTDPRNIELTVPTKTTFNAKNEDAISEQEDEDVGVGTFGMQSRQSEANLEIGVGNNKTSVTKFTPNNYNERELLEKDTL